MPNIPVPVLAALGLLAVLLLAAAVISKNYVKVPNDEVAVFTGRGKPKIVSGEGHLRIPGVEEFHRMSLQPHNIDVEMKNILTKDQISINVSCTGVIGYGRTPEALALSTGNYLRMERDDLDKLVEKVLIGVARTVVSGMTVEVLNNEREEVSVKILEAGKHAFEPNGMEITTFTIQHISDDNGYLDALGAPRNAEVKKNAAIAKANADRDTQIQQAIATREGAVAAAQAETATKEAEKDRDIKVAEIKAEVDARNEEAAQQGPLAAAKAKAAVAVAEADADRQSQEAQIAVENQRSARARAALQADVISPAEAERDAAVIVAEGQRQASVIAAEGSRDASISEAEGDKQKTIAAAEAAAAERKLSSSAEAEATTLLAAADQTKMEAEAAGTVAKLAAQAEGQEKLAAAYNSMTKAAGQLQVLPELVKALPQIVRAVADGVKIDRMVVMDNGSSGTGGSGLQRAASAVPTTLFQANEALKALGFDLTGLLGGIGADNFVSQDESTDGTSGNVSAETTTPTLTSSDESTPES